MSNKTPVARRSRSKGLSAGGTEIVIGLVGAIGVDMDRFQSAVANAISSVGFEPNLIHVSSLMESLSGFILAPNSSSPYYDERVFGLMESGNKFREELGTDALSKLAILAIQRNRNGEEAPQDRHAYILRSLKHADEVKLLQKVYGSSFFLFAAYSPRDTRIQHVKGEIRKSRSDHHGDEWEPTAIKLIQKDEEESSNEYGQQVRKTFWRGDAYIDLSVPDQAEKEIERVVHLWFGHPYKTPTRDEFAMFCSRAAALRSASMGRQVGSCITNEDGSILSTGTNEIPKAGGGQYWEGDPHDYRDHVAGYDSSDTMRRELLEDSLKRLVEAGWTPPVKASIKEQASFVLKHPSMMSAELHALTEYQRPVHAEMSAITDAALRGVSVKGGTLYCTTFPCHACARHIVSSGIKRVVYIEPYAKSLVKTLYPDSVSVDNSVQDYRVRFEPFIGLAPRRYQSLFTMGQRKSPAGMRINWRQTESLPRLDGWESWLSIQKENQVMVDFRLLLEERGYQL